MVCIEYWKRLGLFTDYIIGKISPTPKHQPRSNQSSPSFTPLSALPSMKNSHTHGVSIPTMNAAFSTMSIYSNANSTYENVQSNQLSVNNNTNHSNYLSISSIAGSTHHPFNSDMSMSSIASFNNNVSSNNISSNKTANHFHKKNSRTQQAIVNIFTAILKYLKKQRRIIHQHNHQIKKRFKLELNDNQVNKRRSRLQITYANRLKLLPLNSLSFSFPNDVDTNLLDGYIDLFNWITLCDTEEIKIKNISFDGGSTSPFTFNANENQRSLIWSNILQSQMLNIQRLIMKRILYSTIMFENFANGFEPYLKCIDLQIIFSDEYDDPYLNNDSMEPIRDLFVSLKQCKMLEICNFDFIQHSQNGINNIHSKMIPTVEISWIDNFMKSINIKKTIKTLKLKFNELSTTQFENKLTSSIPKYIKKNHFNLGSILRINKKFQNEIEQLILSWFGECVLLNKIQLIRYITPTTTPMVTTDHFFDNNLHSNRYEEPENSDFVQHKHMDSDDSILNETSENVAFYYVSKNKKKAGDFYGGEVYGELDKILQPQNPVE